MSGEVNDYVIQLYSRKERMIEYMKLKIEEEDWHGVADAAMDIREIVAELLCLSKFESFLKDV